MNCGYFILACTVLTVVTKNNFLVINNLLPELSQSNIINRCQTIKQVHDSCLDINSSFYDDFKGTSVGYFYYRLRVKVFLW